MLPCPGANHSTINLNLNLNKKAALTMIIFPIIMLIAILFRLFIWAIAIFILLPIRLLASLFTVASHHAHPRTPQLQPPFDLNSYGTYLYKNQADGRALYVGYTQDYSGRTSRHEQGRAVWTFQHDLQGRPIPGTRITPLWWPFPDESSAREQEKRSIRELKPVYNRQRYPLT